jgi:two-component system, chemotaxis family, CheB/CheR fusion protein
MPSLHGLKILIVDPDPDSCALLVALLEPFTDQVRVATSSDDAVQLLEELHPSIVVSDIVMPKRDGYWLVEQLKAQYIPAIAVSALPKDEGDRALTAGFCGWFQKPVDLDQLLNALMSFQPNAQAQLNQ